MQHILLKEYYANSLELVYNADDLFENHISTITDNEITIDFSGIEFMSASFTQQYVYHKRNCDKKIVEVNLSEAVAPMLHIIETRKRKE